MGLNPHLAPPQTDNARPTSTIFVIYSFQSFTTVAPYCIIS